MLDTKEERQYKRLRELGQKLHIPIPEAFITLEVFDKDGKLIQRHHQRSHSWTRNAYNVLFCQLAGKDADDDTFGAGKLCQKDFGGALVNGNFPASISVGTDKAEIGPSDSFADVGYQEQNSGYRARAGEDANGILVGSGTNAESFEDFELQTQITEGTGAGQISHVASEEHSISYAALVFKNTLIRYFNNNSDPAGDRDINEVGLVAVFAPATGSTTKAALMSRDKLASTVTVPNTGQLRVTYTIQLTYPS